MYERGVHLPGTSSMYTVIETRSRWCCQLTRDVVPDLIMKITRTDHEIQLIRKLQNPHMVMPIAIQHPSDTEYEIIMPRYRNMRDVMMEWHTLHKQTYRYNLSVLLEINCLHLVQQLIRAVKLIHDHGYVHNNLNLDTILVKPNRVLVLCGFGQMIPANSVSIQQETITVGRIIN